MREIVGPQQPLMPVAVDHAQARELQAVSEILDEAPEICALVRRDVIPENVRSTRGRPGMRPEQVLRVLVLKQWRGFSYDELVFHLEDSRTYRAFCRFSMTDSVPKKPTLCENIKRVRPETLEAINRVVLDRARKGGIEDGRKVRFDTTAMESNIHHPTDNWQLFDVVRVLARIMAKEARPYGCCFANHRAQAKRLHIRIFNARNKYLREPLYSKLLEVANSTIKQALRVAGELDEQDLVAQAVAAELRHYVDLGQKVVDQTERRVLRGESVPAAQKVVSIFEPHTDILIKDGRTTTYGHLLSLGTGRSGMVLDCEVEEGNPADTSLAVKKVERQMKIYGRPPRQTVFDGGFASRENLEAIKGLGVKDVAFSKSRGLGVAEMVKSTWVYKRLRRFRAGVEAGISFLKRCFGLDRCTWRGFASFKAYVWASVVSANLVVLARHLLE